MIEFGTLDFNNLVLLAIAVIGLINTWITIRANATAKAANTIAIETREIAQKTQISTESQASEAKEERAKMAVLFDDALKVVNKKNGRRK